MRQYLVDLRLQHGLSQQDVANRLGISRQYYQMIESGERQKHLALSLASSFAVLYGVSVMDIERNEMKLAKMEAQSNSET
ncbi:MAG TPA: helix-turn-helix transcriptional regulator [Candidatus Anaerofilum excrementigallinarum]|nr:helix-turn-helix transcriptional regulator [Candidatus Anaerofilum excrementigallinarum]